MKPRGRSLAKWTPKDLLAFIVTIWCLWLVTAGVDSWIKYTLLIVTVCYFGIDIIPALKYIKRARDDEEDE